KCGLIRYYNIESGMDHSYFILSNPRRNKTMFNESIELTRKLLIAMGLELQRGTNILIDQDTKSYISFSGKFVKANNDVNKSLYVSEYDIKLDPLDPKCTKVMECLFAKYLEDASS